MSTKRVDRRKPEEGDSDDEGDAGDEFNTVDGDRLAQLTNRKPLKLDAFRKCAASRIMTFRGTYNQVPGAAYVPSLNV